MSTASAPDEPTAPAVKRRIWHYVPLRGRGSKDAATHADSALTAATPWLEEARAGQKRFLPVDIRRAPDGSKIGEAPKNSFEASGDVATALANCPEWDGFLIAAELSRYGWPADAALVQVLHRWSCQLKTAEIEKWKARKLRVPR